MTTPVQGSHGQDKRPEYVDLALKTAQRVFAQFTAKHGVNIDQLGPGAKKVADEMFKLFEAGAKKDGQVVSELVVSAYQQLRHAFELDNAAKFDAGKPPVTAKPTDGTIPPRAKFLLPAEDGRFKLAGSVGPEHLLSKLLQLAGLNPKSLSSKVASEIESARGSAKLTNLTDANTWTTLGRTFRRLAVEEGVGGGVKPEALERAMSNAAVAMGEKPAPQPGLAATPKQGLGLQNTAATTSNTGARMGALATRAQLLAGIKSQGSNAEKTAEGLANAIFEDLKAKDVSPNLRNEVLGVLRDVLKDPRSADGSVRPSTVLLNAYSELAKHERTSYGQLGIEFATNFASVVDAYQAKNPGTGLDKACADMAVGAMHDIVAGMIGKPLSGAADANLKKMSAILTQLEKKSAPKAQVKTEAPKPEASKTGASPSSPAAAAAQEILTAMGVNLEHPKAKELEGVFSDIFAQAKSGQAGEVALHAMRWLVDKGGMPVSFLDNAQSILAEYAKGVMTCDEHIKTFSAEVKDLEAQKAKTTDKGAIAELDANIKSAKDRIASMQQHRSDLEDSFKVARDRALSLVTHATLAPDDFKKQYINADTAATAQAAAGGDGATIPPGGDLGGAGGLGGPGGPGGPDGPGAPNLFPPRGDVTGHLPGLFSPSGPRDTDSTKHSLQQARAMECAKILRDPSLSIEDKIFLFMMLFVSFTDREREEQLEEIVGLDREQARRAQMRDATARDRNSMEQDLGDSIRQLREAEGLRDSLKAAPESPEFKDAQKKVDDLTTKARNYKSRLDEINRKFEAIQRDSDKAPQSREVKFTELQRLSQLRDNILNMARSIMETSNRNVEKVFR